MSAIAVDLTGVPETMPWTLHNRTSEAARPDGVLRDPDAIRIHALAIGRCSGRYRGAQSLPTGDRSIPPFAISTDSADTIMRWTALLTMAYGAALVGALALPPERRRRPSLTFIVCAILAACLVTQLLDPTLVETFRRDSNAISSGQWWRLITALFFQDAGILGGAFNITLLLYVGTVAEQHLSRLQWITIYLLGGIVSETLALSWQPVGAGNSIAACALAGAILVLAVSSRRLWLSNLLRIVAVAATVVLLTMHDIHGGAFFVGATLGAVVLFIRRSAPLQ